MRPGFLIFCIPLCKGLILAISMSIVNGCGSNSNENSSNIPFPDKWTWMSGSDIPDQSGVYGTKGITNSTSIPGSRYYAASWSTGSAFWLFGGTGFDSNGSNSSLNDLWKYDVSTGNWTWVSGSNLTIQPGNYGSLGIPSSTNVPGARRNLASWVIGDDLWLFGGYGTDSTSSPGWLNDLWKYNSVSGQWAWVDGSDTFGQMANYGIKGVAAGDNVPGARTGAYAWTEGLNLWLFGGYGYNATTMGRLNDLWKYDTSTGLWTWVSGSDAVAEVPTYGLKGTPSSTNVPGGRDQGLAWSQGDNLWLFGGYGVARDTGAGRLNDLWKYNIIDDTWTWVSGTDLRYQAGIYGEQGVDDPDNAPGSRTNSVTWKLGADLWMFGGTGYDSIGTAGNLNDTWKFNLTTRQWTWMSGSNIAGQAGTYGSLGVTDVANVPGARTDPVGWIEGNDLWLFGGEKFVGGGVWQYHNDLWKLHR